MRRDDWPERLEETIRAAEGRAFAWGAHDCVTFAAACVAAMTGTDPAALVRGAYASSFGARKTVLEHGDDLYALVTRKFGEPKPAAYARRGDLLGHDGNLGVCIGGVGVFLTEHDGLTRIRVRDCLHCWSVD